MFTRKECTLLLIGLVLIGGSSHASTFRLFRHLNIQNGLPSSQAYSVVQDKKGLIWIGTENGLVRYDGNRAVIYQHQANDANSLVANQVYTLLVDRSGRLWIGTFGGLDRYDQDHQTFIHYLQTSTRNGGLISQSILALAENTDGRIWIGTFGDGLYLLNPATRQITAYHHDPNNNASLSSDNIRALYVDSSGTLWVGTTNGLDRLRRGETAFTHFLHTHNPTSLSNNTVWSIARTSNGGLWVGTSYGLNYSTDDARHFKRYFYTPNKPGFLPGNYVQHLYTDNHDHLWIGTIFGGLAFYDGNDYQIYKHDFSDIYSLNSDAVWDVIVDSSGTLWVATDNGVGYTSLKNVAIDFFPPSKHKTSKSITSPPTYLIADKNLLILGVNNSIDVLNTDNDTVTHLALEARTNIGTVPIPLIITALTATNHDYIWVGTANGELLKVNLQGASQAKRIKYIAKRFASGIQAIFPLDDTSLLIGTGDGSLFTFNTVTRQYTKLPITNYDKPLNGRHISTLFIARYGLVLAGSFSGLYAYKLISLGTGRLALQNVPLPSSLVGTAILSIHQENEGSYWIGTAQGLRHLCFAGYAVILCKENTKTILPDQRIKGIEADNDNNLWISTDHGLFRFNPLTRSILHISTSQGLPFDSFFDRMHAKTPDGRLWFAGSEGLVGIRPRNIVPITTPPKMRITGIKVLRNTRITPLTYDAGTSLVLEPQDKTLTIDYTALDYADPPANIYKYRLLGFGTNWIDAGHNHEAIYTNLDPGHYRFEVSGTNNWGVWSRQPATLDIVVLPPWWRAWWAYTLYALLVTLSLAAFVYLQQRRVSRAQEINRQLREADAIKSRFVEELQERVETATRELRETLEAVNVKNAELMVAQRRAAEGERLKSEFLANISHELRTPLAAVLGYLKLLSGTRLSAEQEDYVRTLRQSSEALLAIINDTLDLARIESGKLLIDEVDFDLLDVIEGTIELLAPTAYQKRLELLRIVPAEVPLQLRGDPLRLRQILTNLVGNAIKFTESGSVCIRVRELHRDERHVTLAIAVTDTGIGIPENAIAGLFEAYSRHETRTRAPVEGTGLGLAICKRLLDLMDGKIEVFSTPGMGSTFEFSLPVKLQKSPAPPAVLPGAPLVVLLDDHPLSSQAWQASLARLGARVIHAREAAAAHRCEADVLVMALNIEKMTRDKSQALRVFSNPLPRLVLAPLVERSALEQVGREFHCRALSKAAREITLLAELRSLLQARPPPAEEMQAVRAARVRPAGGPLVLVADDNAINRKLLVTLLAHAGLRTAEAASGEELLKLAASETWNTALVDIHMPGMNGIEVLARLRALYGVNLPPVIAVSADVSAETRAQALAAGMVDYLIKPFSEDQLLAVLRKHLARSPAPPTA